MAATLPDFTTLGGMPSPASGRAIATPNTTAIGLGLESLGNSIASTADTLQKTWNANKTADAQSAYLAFQASEDQAYNDATQKLKPEDAQGFAQSYFQGYQQRAKPFLDALPATVRPGYGDKVFVDGQRLLDSAQTFEHTQAKTYGLNTIDATINQTILPRARLAAGLPADDPTKKPTLDAITNDALWLIDANQSLTAAEKEAKKATTKAQIQTGFAQSLPPAERIGVDPAAIPAAAPTTADLLRKEEGFAPRGQWDVNAFRGGFGSDTVTHADGTIEKITKDTVITPEDAERDLQRKIPILERANINQVGGAAWDALSPGAKAALDSLTYNHGSLPPAVVAAIQTGDPNKIADAVSALPAWSKDPQIAKALLGRRQREAQLIRGGQPTWGTALDAIPYDSKVTIAQDGAAALVRQQTAANTAQTQQHQSWVNAVENAIQDNKFGLTDVQSAYDSGQLTSATERQHFTDLINTRDKDGLNLAAATTKIADPTYRSQYDPNSDKVANLWYDKGPGKGGAGLLDGPQIVDDNGKPIPADQRPLSPQDVLAMTVQRTGVVPASAAKVVGQGIYSPDPRARDRAFQVMDGLAHLDPAAYQQAFIEADRKRLDLYQALAPTVPPDVLAKALDVSDPQTMKTRAVMEAQAKTDFTKLFPDAGSIISAAFPNTGVLPFGLFASYPGAPVDAGAAASFVSDFQAAYVEAFGMVHNQDTAKQLAAKWVTNKWGPTDVGSGSNTIMAYPPERYYPALNGDHAWMDAQFEGSVKAIAPDAQKWWIQETPQTAIEATSGSQPTYYAWYTDKSGVWHPATDDTGSPLALRFNYEAAQQAAVADFAAKNLAAIAVQQSGILDLPNPGAVQGIPLRDEPPASTGASQPRDNIVTQLQGDVITLPGQTAAAPAGGLDFSAFGANAANVQTLVQGGMAASGRTAQQVLDDPQYRAAIINKGWATEPEIDGIVNAPQRPKNSKDARVQDAAGQYGLPGVAPSDSPIGAVANIGGAVVGAAQNIWNGFTGSRVVQQFMSGWDNPQGISRKGKGDKLPIGPLPASPAAMSTAVEDFSDRKSFGAAYERYFQAPPTEGLTQEMIVAAAQRAQAKDAAAKAGKAASGGVEGLNAFLNLMLVINQGIAESAAKKAGR